MRIAPERIENAAKELYVRALKDLPPDIKRGFATLAARETGATAKAVLGTMIENIAVAERTGNLLCQDTGIPIYNVMIGRDAEVDGVLAWTEQPLVKTSEVALVFLLAAHLAGGLRLLLAEFGAWRASWQPALIAAAGGAAVLCALLFALNLA